MGNETLLIWFPFYICHFTSKTKGVKTKSNPEETKQKKKKKSKNNIQTEAQMLQNYGILKTSF